MEIQGFLWSYKVFLWGIDTIDQSDYRICDKYDLNNR